MHSKRNHRNGTVIVLAWPQTYCKQPGSWYDGLMTRLGVSRNHFYKAGHAALVLIEPKTGKCHYFDFGRYHSPFKHGRVRSAKTDHDLELKTAARFFPNSNVLANYNTILDELQSRKAFHGDGELYASYGNIKFKKAFRYAHKLQKLSPLPYGPFKYKGSNCSRFVNTVLLKGGVSVFKWLKLYFFVPLTPTPLNNVNAFENKKIVPKKYTEDLLVPNIQSKYLKQTLVSPQRHPDVPLSAQWLAGEGAGSWYLCNIMADYLEVARYSVDGKLECNGMFANRFGEKIRKHEKFKVYYPSNCKEVTLIQNGEKFSFMRVVEDQMYQRQYANR